MQCDGTPDPTNLPDINTFISLWRDEQQRIDVEHTIDQTNLVLSLIKELNNIIDSIPNGSPELERISIYKKVYIRNKKKTTSKRFCIFLDNS
jgi:hypothetical protein